MSDQEFERLVRRLESEAASGPRAYQVKLAALASLAYVYVFGIVLLAVGLLGLIVWATFLTGTPRYGVLKLSGKAGLAIVTFLAAVGRALHVRLEEPRGIPVEAADHPALFDEIESLRKAAGAPRIHKVLFSPELNASIVQLPRLGVLGWPRNYLTLGLPLMKALSLDGFRVVLAHELGHLSGSHGRWGAWIYASRLRWRAILEQMERDDHWASFLFRPFFRWYAPWFNAYSFVQARQQEYEADRIAAQLVDAQTAGETLSTLNIRGRELDTRWWPMIEARMGEVAVPDVRPFADMAFTGSEPATEGEWLSQDLAQPTTVHDTHPSLTDRLAALGVEATVAAVPETPAADALLRNGGRVLGHRMDTEWKDRIEGPWRQRHEEIRENRAVLARLEGTPPDERSLEDAWALARLTEMERPEADSLPLYRDVLDREPDHPGASYAVGRLLLVAGEDEDGLTYLDRAASLDDEAIVPACALACSWLQARGRDAEAEAWRARAERHEEKLDAAHEERSGVRLDGRWEPHGLTGDQIEPLAAFLNDAGGVQRAWLLRRQLDHYPEFPLFLLVARRRAGLSDWLSRSTKRKRDLALQDALGGAPLGGDGFILVTNHRAGRERRQLEGIAGSEIGLA